MIIIMKPHASKESILTIEKLIESNGLDSHISYGREVTIIGVVGDKTKLQEQNLEIFKMLIRLCPLQRVIN